MHACQSPSLCSIYLSLSSLFLRYEDYYIFLLISGGFLSIQFLLFNDDGCVCVMLCMRLYRYFGEYPKNGIIRTARSFETSTIHETPKVWFTDRQCVGQIKMSTIANASTYPQWFLESVFAICRVFEPVFGISSVAFDATNQPISTTRPRTFVVLLLSLKAVICRTVLCLASSVATVWRCFGQYTCLFRLPCLLLFAEGSRASTLGACCLLGAPLCCIGGVYDAAQADNLIAHWVARAGS